MAKDYAFYRQSIIELQDERSENKPDYEALDQLRAELKEAEIWDLYGYVTYRIHSYWGVTHSKVEKAKLYLAELEALKDIGQGVPYAYKYICESEMLLITYQKANETIQTLDILKSYLTEHNITDTFLHYMMTYLYGNSYRTLGNFQTAQKYFYDCTVLKLDLLYIFQKIMGYYMYGVVSHDLYQDENAIKSFSKSLKLAKQYGSPIRIAHSEVAVASIYSNHEEYDIALQMYHKALNVYEATNQIIQMRRMYNDLGLLYLEINDYPKAIEYLNKALKIYETNELISGHTMTLIQLSRLYTYTKQIDKAAQCLTNAEEMMKKYPQWNVCKVTLMKAYAEYHIYLEDYDKAVEYLNNALEMNSKDPDDTHYLYIYQIFVDLYEKIEQYKLAFEYQSKILQLKDKFAKEDKKTTLEMMLKKIEADELKEELNAKLEKERYEAVWAMIVTTNHEINQPLTVAKLNLNMVMSDKNVSNLNEKQLKWLSKIEGALSKIEYTVSRYTKDKVHKFFNYLPDTKMLKFGEVIDADKWTVEEG